MAVTNPDQDPITARFNWVTTAGASVLKNLPLGGAVGVVCAGVVLWLGPHVIPAGWTAEAVLSLGMGLGVVLHRLATGLLGWLLEPLRRHLGAGLEARLRLAKLDRYRDQGLLEEADAAKLAATIVKEDVTVKVGKQ